MTKTVQATTRVRLEGLQVIRGIAALAVLLYHEQGFLSAAVPASSANNEFTALFRWGYAGVDVFFVLSGFLIVYVHYDDIGFAPRVADYLWRRASRIYSFYCLLCIFLIPAVFIAPALFTNAGKQNLLRLISSVLLLPKPGMPLLGVTWPLQHELYFIRYLCADHCSAKGGMHSGGRDIGSDACCAVQARSC
jgi:peptidoglycan/LPS O-acetylase OafA/YrhL